MSSNLCQLLRLLLALYVAYGLILSGLVIRKHEKFQVRLIPSGIITIILIYTLAWLPLIFAAIDELVEIKAEKANLDS